MPRIRLVTPHDGDALTELQQRNREYLAPWEPIRGEDYFTAAGQRAEIGAALARYDRGEVAPFVILDDDGSVAGRLTLSGIVRGAFQSCSMGYWVSEDRTGRGIAYAFAELGLHRVQAETVLGNDASQRVLDRAGFERYGLAPGYLRIAGRWQDHLLFQRLNEDA
jgi:ribosomal-protein-alanine N-acetyltransferase